MFERLSDSQRQIVDCDSPRIVVKASPGSGKTFSVTARFAKLIKENKLSRHQGIAVMSFTNTACEEIRKGLTAEYAISDMGHPHFIGTIDSFINNYIFLPFGHLLMGCNQRPEIIGTQYNKWFDYDASIKSCDLTKIIDPNYFFDKVSFNVNDEPIPLVPASTFNFSWARMRNRDDAFRKDVKDIITAKITHFAGGKANQSDANYFAYKILCKYPAIALNITQRFPTIIVDEAQDTTTVQMAIIDVLDRVGARSIMLIGDPDQAIFEWNTADSSLFIEKWNSKNWESLELSENRRSSINICSVINNFFNGTMISVAPDRDCFEFPELKLYQADQQSVSNVVAEFMAKCQELNIAEDSLAIVCRGAHFGEKYLGIVNQYNGIDNSMWKNDQYYVRDIVSGKYLIDNGEDKKGFQLIEKGCYKKKHNLKYISAKALKAKIDGTEFREYRQALCRYVDKLPATNQALSSWIAAANKNECNFSVNNAKANVEISKIFQSDKRTVIQPSYYRTIHSVKGMSLDAVLVFITKHSASKNYSTIFAANYKETDPDKKSKDDEEVRIIYVACSRPKKLLWIAVPADDSDCWARKLGLFNDANSN